MPEVEFLVPVAGELGNIPDNELPINALRTCQNFFRNEKGRLVMRPGYKQLTATYPTDRVMGIGHFHSDISTDQVIAGTITKLWVYDPLLEVFINRTGVTPLTGGNKNHVRFVTMFASGVYNVIAMNGIDVMQQWNNGIPNFTDVTGAPPIGRAGAVCANRLLVLEGDNAVRVSEFNNFNSWPAGNGFNMLLVDAGDLLVGMDQLTRTSVAVLGSESQWVIRAQSGSNPMRPERISNFPGPMSSAALVRAGAVVYWLATDYNVYRFDGTTTQAVGDAMMAFVKRSINLIERQQSHGVYCDELWKIFWFFPTLGSLGPNLGIFLDVRTGEMGRLKFSDVITASGRVHIATIGETWDSLGAAGYTWNSISASYPNWDSFGNPASERRAAFGALTGNLFIANTGDGSDNGKAIEGVIEFPLKSYAGWPANVVPATFETFFKKSPVSTVVETALGWTDTLMQEDPYYTNLLPFDLVLEQRNDVDLTAVTQKRFVSIKHKVTAAKGRVEFQGAVFRFEGEAIEHGPTGV
jgi:hypothetical protein